MDNKEKAAFIKSPSTETHANSPNFVQNESVLNEIVLFGGFGGFGVLAGLGVGPP